MESNIHSCRRAMHFQAELPYVASSALLPAPVSSCLLILCPIKGICFSFRTRARGSLREGPSMGRAGTGRRPKGGGSEARSGAAGLAGAGRVPERRDPEPSVSIADS